MSSELNFKIDPDLKFEEVTPFKFFTYLEDIKRFIQAHMPHWHINRIPVASSPAAIYYHLCQWDFQVPPGKTWPHVLDSHIFGIERADACLILNRYPIHDNKDHRI